MCPNKETILAMVLVYKYGNESLTPYNEYKKVKRCPIMVSDKFYMYIKIFTPVKVTDNKEFITKEY